MKRIVFANDYSSIKHYGSQLLNANLKQLISVQSIVTHCIPFNQLEFTLHHQQIANSDVVIINGEGNMHNLSDKAKQIFDFAVHVKSQGKRIALVNSVIHAPPKCIDLNVFDYISVRESLSYQELQNRDVRGAYEIVPDATLLSSPVSQNIIEPNVIVTDCVVPEFNIALKKIAKDIQQTKIPVSFLPFDYSEECNACPSIDAVLNRFSEASLIISGRFHANCFAILTGTPVISVESNTHKTAGLMKDLNLEEFHFNSPIELRRYLNTHQESLLSDGFVRKAKINFYKISNDIESSIKKAVGF